MNISVGSANYSLLFPFVSTLCYCSVSLFDFDLAKEAKMKLEVQATHLVS